jgi:hypothetical protein
LKEPIPSNYLKSCLRAHYELGLVPATQLPQYASQQHAMWAQLIAEAKGQYERDGMNNDSDERVTTDIGPMAKGGKTYYQFLVGFRHAVESNATDQDKTEILRHLIASNPSYKEFAKRHHKRLATHWKKFMA